MVKYAFEKISLKRKFRDRKRFYRASRKGVSFLRTKLNHCKMIRDEIADKAFRIISYEWDLCDKHIKIMFVTFFVCVFVNMLINLLLNYFR